MMTSLNPNLYNEWEPLVRVEGIVNVLDVPLTIAHYDHHFMYNFLGLSEVAEFMVLVNVLSRLDVAVGKGGKNLEVDDADIRKGFRTAAPVDFPDHLKIRGKAPTQGALELLKDRSIIREWKQSGKGYAIELDPSKMVQERLREILYDELISEGFKSLNSTVDLRRFSTLEDAAHLNLLESLEGSLESYRALRKGFLGTIRLGAFASRLTFLSSKIEKAPYNDMLIPCINLLYTSSLNVPIKIGKDDILRGRENPLMFIEDHLKEQKEKLRMVFCEEGVRSVICRIFDRYIRSWKILTWGLKMKPFVYFPHVEEGSEEVDRILVRCIIYPNRLPGGKESQNRFSMQEIQNEHFQCGELFDNAGLPFFGTLYAAVDLGKCRGGEQE
jgi:hypothetical protein